MRGISAICPTIHSITRDAPRSVWAGLSASGQMKVGALASFASSLLTGALISFAKIKQDTLVDIHKGPLHDLTSLLRNSCLGLVVGRLGKPNTMVGLRFQQVYSVEELIVAYLDSPALRVGDFAAINALRVL